jgi:hypothetical protein
MTRATTGADRGVSKVRVLLGTESACGETSAAGPPARALGDAGQT